MNNIQVFNNPEFGQVRTITKDNELLFVGKDVAECLGYKDTKSAIRDHINDKDKTIIQRRQNTTLEIPNRGLTIINESGLYSLILASKLPTAKKFKHWVTSEVLPSIRKYGSYSIKNDNGVDIDLNTVSEVSKIVKGLTKQQVLLMEKLLNVTPKKQIKNNEVIFDFHVDEFIKINCIISPHTWSYSNDIYKKYLKFCKKKHYDDLCSKFLLGRILTKKVKKRFYNGYAQYNLYLK